MNSAVGAPSFQGFLWRPALGTSPVDGTGGWIVPLHVNDQGQIAGKATLSPNAPSTFGVLWTPANGPSAVVAGNLPVEGVQQINNAGEMVLGSSECGESYFYHPGGAPVPIGSAATALGINDQAQVAGYHLASDGYSHAFTWTQAAGMLDLPIPWVGNSVATGLNNYGLIVGYEDLINGSRIGFVYNGSTLTQLFPLIDQSAEGWSDLTPQAINDNGQIAGYGRLNGQLEGFLLTSNFASPDLPSAPEPATLPLLALAGGALVARRRKERVHGRL